MLNEIKKLKKAVCFYKQNNGFIGSDLNCCPNCNGIIEEENTDYIEHTMCECTYYCPRCQTKVGEWAYGTVNPYSLHTRLKPEKVSKILDQMFRKAEKE